MHTHDFIDIYIYNVCNNDKEKDAVNLRMAERHGRNLRCGSCEGLEGAKRVEMRCNSVPGKIFGNKRKYKKKNERI